MKGILLILGMVSVGVLFGFEKDLNDRDQNIQTPDRLIIRNCCNKFEPKDSCIALMKTVQAALYKYEKYGSLLDTSGSEINTNSIQRFYSMFIYGKKQQLMNDLSWMKEIDGCLQPTEIEMISAQKYAELVYFVHQEKGFKFKLFQPVCQSIRYDEYYKSYLVTVFTRKDLYTRIDEDGQSAEMKNGNIVVKIIFDVPKDDFEKIKIRNLYN